MSCKSVKLENGIQVIGFGKTKIVFRQTYANGGQLILLL